MKNPKISVLIPVFNGEKTIGQCLDSVVKQTYKNFEVVVVNNNSFDGSEKIIKEFQEMDNRIRCVFETEIGRGAARNTGIKSARGDIIAMTDSDCVVPEGWLERITEPIVKSGERVVMGSEDDAIKNYWTKNIQRANQKFLKENTEGGYINHIDTKNFAIESSLMERLMFDSNFKNLEDFELYLRLKKLSIIRFIPSVRVRHNHKSTFTAVLKISFNRGYWAAKIYKKHKIRQTITESISLKNFLSFPFWVIVQFFRRPLGESFFMFVWEIPWRAGILWAMIR